MALKCSPLFSPVRLACRLFFWIRVYYTPHLLTVWVRVRRALSGICMNRAGLDAQMVDGTHKPIGQFVMMGSWHNEPEWPLLEMPAIELYVYLALLQVSHKIGIWGVFVVAWTMCCEISEPPGTCVLPIFLFIFRLNRSRSLLLIVFCQ